MLGDFDWGDCTITFQARKTGGREGFAVYFRNSRGGSQIEWNVGGWDNSQHGIIGHQSTHSDTPTQVTQVDGAIDADRWYDVRIELEGEHVRCSLDGEKVHDVEIPKPVLARLCAVASRDEAAGETIVKVVNPTDEPATVALNLAGADVPAQDAKVVVLTGGPDDENSVDEPLRVSPRASTLAIASGNFEREFPAQSLTVIRVKLE
jgi:alpha-L-arabinofuranosidase